MMFALFIELKDFTHGMFSQNLPVCIKTCNLQHIQNPLF